MFNIGDVVESKYGGVGKVVQFCFVGEINGIPCVTTTLNDEQGPNAVVVLTAEGKEIIVDMEDLTPHKP